MIVLLPAAMMAAIVAAAPPITIQDNSRAAGQLAGNVLTVRLVVDVGSWRPNGDAGAPLDVRAFGEEGRPLSIPAPLIRGREGTDVSVAIRNALNQEVRLFGMCTRPGACAPLPVAAGQSRDVRFTLSTARAEQLSAL